MFSWASEQFERLSQTVAPPPTDPVGRFAYCCQRRDEEGAIDLVPQLPGAGVYVNQVKEQCPIHMACLYSLPNLARLLLTQPGASVDMVDGDGNSVLHCAAMSTLPTALGLVKTLVNDVGANVSTKNKAGQTPYDVATLNTIRQFLLPLQLQKETAEAIANGGLGLPPGIDLGGLRIQNSHLPPPPTFGGPPSSSGPPSGGPPAPPNSAPVFQSRPPAAPPAPPTSGPNEYARVGSSSAAIYKSTSAHKSFVTPDGFHSSSSDKRLQQKYGHVSAAPPSAGSLGAGGGGFMPPPPPAATGMGEQRAVSAPSNVSAANPYAGGFSAFKGGARPSRYVSYDPVSGAKAQVPVGGGPPTSMYPNYAPPNAATVGGYQVFRPSPGATPPVANMSMPQQQQQQQSGMGFGGQSSAAYAPAPGSGNGGMSYQAYPQQAQQAYPQQQPPPPVAASGAFPPPPYSQLQHTASTASAASTSSSTPMASAANAAHLFATPSPTLGNGSMSPSSTAATTASETTSFVTPQKQTPGMSFVSPLTDRTKTDGSSSSSASALFARPQGSPTAAAAFGTATTASTPVAAVAETFAAAETAAVAATALPAEPQPEAEPIVDTSVPVTAVAFQGSTERDVSKLSTASDLFSSQASSSQEPSAANAPIDQLPAAQQALEASVAVPVSSATVDEDEMDGMTEIPLTPSIPDQMPPSQTDPKQVEPVDSNVYASIGMPPPPFSQT